MLVFLAIVYPINSHAIVLGERFSESLYKDFPKVNGKNPDHDVYRLVNPDSGRSSCVKVSIKTDAIFELESTGYPNIYEALAMASVICEGEVEMPTVASEGRFYLKSTPGGKHAGKSFEFYIIEPCIIG